MSKKHKGPKILFMDIETAPMLAYVWALWDQNVGLNQIEKDWHILSWAAKWEHEKTVMYQDQSDKPVIENDKEIMKGMWKLLDEADIVVTQNGIKFDHRKINARFLEHGFTPPSPFEVVDTYRIARKHFDLTSNKLEYMCDKFNVKYKKLTSKHRKYIGFDLWKACLKGVKKAWAEMKRYNKYDVLALEELFHTLIKWEPRINRSKYIDDITDGCFNCGSPVKKDGHFYTSRGKYQRYRCKNKSCGISMRDNDNKLSTTKRRSMYYKVK